MEEAKTLSIMGLFDREAAPAFSRLRAELKRRGVPVEDQEPHLTFGIYEGIEDREAFLGWVAQVALFQTKPRLNFDHVGLFPQGVCFAGPCASRALLALHGSLHARYDQKCSEKNCLYSLKANSWVPHVTLGVWEPERAGEYLPVLLETFRPVEATIEKLAVTEYPPMRTLREFPLGEG